MKNFLLATTALVAAASATTVFAADLIIDAPAPYVEMAVANDWTGAYIGGHVGAGSADIDWEVTGGGASGEYDASGWLLGVQGGYNWQMDSIVFGIEADASWADISGESPDFGPGDVTRSIDWTASLRGRLGFAVDSLLIYGTAGLAAASSTGEVFGNEDSNTHFGWTAGVGVEAMVTEDISLRAEYRYTTYDDQEYDYGFVDVDTGFDSHAVTVGLNFHF